MDLSWVGVLPSQTPPLRERIPHRVLWIVRHFVFDGVGRGEGSPSTDPGAVEPAWADDGTVDVDAMMGRYVVLDSGFCVLRALIELKKVSLFSCAVIRKR